MRVRATAIVVSVAAFATAMLAPAAVARAPREPKQTVPASGSFSFSTANGILPTWSSEDIAIIGVSPGSVTTASSNLTARVVVPIIAKTGSANAAGGGFRLNDTATGASVRCSNPTIDTRARVIDCVLPTLRNAALFDIRSIESRSRVVGESTITWIYRGVVIGINGDEMADLLNEALSSSAFSPYVTVGRGDLVVTVDRLTRPTAG